MITKLCTQKTAWKMQTNASQNLQCNFISHNNQMNAFCLHFACIWSIVFQRAMIVYYLRQYLPVILGEITIDSECFTVYGWTIHLFHRKDIFLMHRSTSGLGRRQQGPRSCECCSCKKFCHCSKCRSKHQEILCWWQMWIVLFTPWQRKYS